MSLDSRNESAVRGATAFIDGFGELQSSTITPAQTAKLRSYYDTDFVPKIEQRAGLDYSTDAFIPASPAGRYLQSYYTAGRSYEDFDAGLALTDAGDGSAWSKANATYGGYFTGFVNTLGYEDALIIDRDGNVAYSAYKSVDLGMNLTEEPYASSVLSKGYQEVLRNGSLDEVVTTDFERYLPSLNVPTAWVMSPIGSATDIIGVLAIQVPIDQINDVMTGDQKWEQQGLGDTGEVYLAGTDKLMRSTSRLLGEHPDEYARTVIENGTPRSIAERIVAGEGHRAAAAGGVHRRQRGAGRPHRGRAGRRLHRRRQPGGLCAAGDRGSGLGDRRPHRRGRGLRPGDRLHPGCAAVAAGHRAGVSACCRCCSLRCSPARSTDW